MLHTTGEFSSITQLPDKALRFYQDEDPLTAAQTVSEPDYPMRSRYDEIGQRFKILGRTGGHHLAGPAFSLHHCTVYQEEDAAFEACFPIKKAIAGDGN